MNAELFCKITCDGEIRHKLNLMYQHNSMNFEKNFNTMKECGCFKNIYFKKLLYLCLKHVADLNENINA